MYWYVLLKRQTYARIYIQPESAITLVQKIFMAVYASTCRYLEIVSFWLAVMI